MAQDEASLNNFFSSLQETSSAHANDAVVPPGKRPCPICRAAMAVRVVQGTSIDECADHGIWLDLGKLASIQEAKAVSTEYQHKRDLNRAQQKGKLKGMLGGFGAFLPE